jgi:MoaA/NifB/PqqE/SkfB family radical SAM enzyme
LQRAIVSLHSFRVEESCEMSGISVGEHQRVLGGVEALWRAGVETWINAVLGRPNLESMADFVDFIAEKWPTVSLKISFPLSTGKGEGWSQLRYEEIREPLQKASERAEKTGIRLALEGIPPCLGVPSLPLLGRVLWGETHQLSERDGRTVLSVAEMDALTRVLGENCGSCSEVQRCPGVGLDYVRERGMPELRALGGAR